MENTDWLIVESPANWKIDEGNGFTYFGVTGRFEYLKDRVKVGDRLFAYVSGKSAFADVRVVTKAGLRTLRGGGDYDIPLPFCVDTKPALTLPEDRWLPMSEVRERLKLTAGKQHWTHVLRTAFKKLEPEDGALLAEAMQARLPASVA